MKKNEELLQRFIDNDLTDEEMKNLFSEMSRYESLRTQFRSLQSLRVGLQSVPVANIPSSLDEKIKLLSSKPQVRFSPNKSAMRRVFDKKFTLSIPAFATIILLLLVGSYFAATNVFVQKQKTEYVYVVELQPVIINSNYSN